jgi:hypothetical protein
MFVALYTSSMLHNNGVVINFGGELVFKFEPSPPQMMMKVVWAV